MNTTTSNKVQWVYDAGMFSGAINGLIDTFWLRTSSTNAGVFTSGFEISLGQSATYGPWTNGTYITGLTSVFAPGAYTTAVPNANGWIPFPLASPFLYDPLQPMVVEVKQSGYTSGLQSAQFSGNGNRRIWGPYAATTGSFGAGLIDAGLSLSSPLNCATPFPLSTANVTQTTADLAWVENNATPATLWNIELLPTGTPPTGIATYPGVTTNPYPVSGLTQNTTYDFYVQADCGMPDSLSYWYGPLTFTTLATCPWPTALGVTNITSTSADIFWTENGTATIWDLEVVPSGVTPTGTPNVPGISANPFSLTGLPPNTCFDYYVRSFCGPLVTDVSQWTGPLTFCTPCVPELPTTAVSVCDDLEGWTLGQNGPIANGCGTMVAHTGPYWNVDVGGTGSGGTGPLTDHTPGTAAGKYIYLETSTGAGADTFLTTQYDLTGLTVPCFSFYYHMHGAAMGTLDVEITSDGGATWTNIASFVGQQQAAQADPYLESVTNLAAYANMTVGFRFIGIRGTSFTSDMAVDMICVLECPSCVAPTNIASANVTQSTADISWTENNTPAATLWNIEIVPQATPPTGIPTASGVTMPYAVTGLTASSCYDVYVQSDCGVSNGVSGWTGPYTFCTLCGPISVATFCQQGQFTPTTIPTNCWSNTSTDASTSLNNFWKFNGGMGYHNSNTLDHTASTLNTGYAWVDGSSPYTGQTITLQAPPILNADIVAMTNPMLEFYMKATKQGTAYGGPSPGALTNASADHNTLEALVSYDNGTTWVSAVFHNGQTGDLWHRYQAELDATALGTNDLLVKFDLTKLTLVNSFYNDIAIDDVCIIDADCPSQFTGIATADGISDCECLDLAGWTHYGVQASGERTISVLKAATNDPNMGPWMVHVQGAATGATDIASTAGYGNPVPASVNTFVMNRFWDVFVDATDAVRQPTAATDVRFYYGDADLTDLNTAIVGAGGVALAHTDMYAYKLDNSSVAMVDPVASAGHASTPAADYNHYVNGASSTTTWAYAAGLYPTTHDLDYQVNSFSGGGGGGPVLFPLPVELLSFTATKTGSVTDLAWTTATEENNSHFNVLKSTNGTDFEQIGSVNSFAPNGNSSIRLSYSSVDESPVLGHNYYRLEQVDIDGQKHYSEILDVIWGVNGDLVSIYPNPTNGSLNVDIATEKVSKVEVRVLDMTGRSILIENATTVIGINNVQMDLGNIAPGIYNVQVYTNGNLTHTDKVKKN